MQNPSWSDTCLPILLQLSPSPPDSAYNQVNYSMSPLPETFSDPKDHSFGFLQYPVLMSFCTSPSFSLLHLTVNLQGWKLCLTQCLAHNRCLINPCWMKGEGKSPQWLLGFMERLYFNSLIFPMLLKQSHSRTIVGLYPAPMLEASKYLQVLAAKGRIL